MSSAPVEYARSPIPSVCRKPGAILGEQTSLPLFPLLLVDVWGGATPPPFLPLNDHISHTGSKAGGLASARNSCASLGPLRRTTLCGAVNDVGAN